MDTQSVQKPRRGTEVQRRTEHDMQQGKPRCSISCKYPNSGMKGRSKDLPYFFVNKIRARAIKRARERAKN